MIIDQIPAKKEELFAYGLKWDVLQEAGVLGRKVESWVAKKVVEYMGAEEKELVQFAMEQIVARKSPHEMIEQLQIVLEEEAEMFVIKLWRMLIFEQERFLYQQKKTTSPGRSPA